MRFLTTVAGLTMLLPAVFSATPALAESDTDLEDAIQSVVLVETATGVGAGFVVGSGEILTAAHVVDGASAVEVVTGSNDRLRGAVVRTDEALDVALLEVDGAMGDPLRVRKDLPAIGEEVYAVGNPAGEGFSVSRGIVSSVRARGAVTYVQTDAAINPGNSGGPLLDATGAVVGLVTSKLEDTEGLGFALASRHLTGVLDADPRTGGGDHPPTVRDSSGRGSQGVPTWVYATLLLPLGIVMTLVRRRPRPIRVRLHGPRNS